jgi:hypothetical protein
MKRFFITIFEFFEQISNAPETVRRRWANILFLGSLPLVAFLWWLTLHYSLEERTAPQALKSALLATSDVSQDVRRGITNLQIVFESLRDVVRATLKEEALKQEQKPDSFKEYFPLPISE